MQSVKDYMENKYRAISYINDIPTLTQYLENTDIARHINQFYYDETKDRFLKLIKDVNDISVANLLYQALSLIHISEPTRQVR